MSMDLIGLHGSYFCSNQNFYDLLNLAFKNGWKPKGTEYHSTQDPTGSEWDPDNYVTHDRQTVTEEDARSISTALTIALDFIPGGEAFRVREFIKFAQGGSFTIG